MLNLVRKTLQEKCRLDRKMRYLVALSGGADSVALLRILLEENYEVEAAHCHFHLRGEESDRDAAFCQSLCHALGVNLHLCHFDTLAEAGKHGESIEMAARRLRYRWFGDLCEKYGFEAVCVAHHGDDDVETLLLNLVRGTGIHGLTGMAYRRDKVVRPLLDVSRQDIVDYLHSIGQEYVEDSTNADTKYKRNLVRHEVIPLLKRLNPSVVRTLRMDMRKLDAARETYDYISSRLIPDYADPMPHGYAFPLERMRMKALYDAWGKQFGFSEADVLSLYHRGGRLTERAMFVSPGYLAALYRDRLEVVRKPPVFSPVPLAEGREISLPDGGKLDCRIFPHDALETLPRVKNRVALDADKVKGTLRYRLIKEGDRFCPFGMKGSKKVSDYLTDCKFSRLQRLWKGVVEDEAGILWLAGERPDRRAAVVPQTRRILLLRYAPADEKDVVERT